MDGPTSIPTNRKAASLSVGTGGPLCPSSSSAYWHRDSTPQNVWVHVEGFVNKKHPKPVRKSRELSSPEGLCADKWRL